MELVELEVEDFGAVGAARVEFGAGLGVLYGPNDLGKSTLAHAIRAALLLQPGSSAARRFVPWGTDRKPRVALTFRHGEHVFRVCKTFAKPGGRASLEELRGQSASVLEEGRAVDAELRRLLGWGLSAPGGRGGTHGLPKSFLSTALLGEQATPYGLFDQSLADDPEASGKEQLVAALQSLAADPEYGRVLERVRERVDEAFTDKGKRSRARSSPFVQASQEVGRRRQVYEELERQLRHSEAVSERLSELNAQTDRLRALFTELSEELEALELDHRRCEQRDEAQRQVDAARAIVDEIDRVEAELRTRQSEVQRLEASLGELEAAMVLRTTELEAARDAQGQAKARWVACSDESNEGDDPRSAALRRRRVELQGRRGALERVLERVEALDRARQEREASQTTCAKLEEVLREQSEILESLEREEHALRERVELLEAGRARQAWLEANEAVQRIEHKRAQAREHRSKAEALRARARDLADPTAALSEEDFVALQRRRSALVLEEAKLGGGLSIGVQLNLPTALRVRRDGGKIEALDAPAQVEADRSIELQIGELATLDVTTGEARARKAYEASKRAFERALAPILKRLDLRDWDALVKARTRAEKQRAQAETWLTEAEGLERVAEATSAGASDEERRAAVATAKARAEAMAPWTPETHEELGRRLTGLEPRTLDEELARAREERQAQQGRAELARRSVERTRAELEVARVTLERSEQAVKEALARVDAIASSDEGEGLPRDADAIETMLEEIDVGRAEVERAWAEREQEAHRAREDARTRLDTCEASLRAAKEQHDAAVKALEEARGELGTHRGALEVLRGQLERADRAKAREALERTSARLAELPEPSREVDLETLDAARARLDAARQALRDAEDEVRKQEGALAEVGGQVVRERAEFAREALESAQRAEQEVELDYEGWRLLLQTLRDAENEEGKHLGDALGRVVRTRFARLTRGRYDALALDPALKAEGIETADGVKPIGDFSEGVKEQLATIFRISVAEQLRGALVLDDHLTQTDPARIHWFRDMLEEAGAQVQIIVFTCRPDDYLDGSERVLEGQVRRELGPRRYAVDLERVIERVDPRTRSRAG